MLKYWLHFTTILHMICDDIFLYVLVWTYEYVLEANTFHLLRPRIEFGCARKMLKSMEKSSLKRGSKCQEKTNLLSHKCKPLITHIPGCEV